MCDININVYRLILFCKIVAPTQTDFSKHDKFCFFMHGTSGFTYNCKNYMKILKKLGFVIIAPDHNRYHFRKCKCTVCGKDLKYNTTINFVKHNNKIYDYAANFRTKELEACVKYFSKLWNLKNKTTVIAVGVSEGGIAVSQSDIPAYITKFIFSFSIEKTYFTPHCNFNLKKQQKVIQTIGTHDEFFGRRNSIACHFNEVNGHGLNTFKNFHHQNYAIFLLEKQPHSLLSTKTLFRKNSKIISHILCTYSAFGARQNLISPKFATLYLSTNG